MIPPSQVKTARYGAGSARSNAAPPAALPRWAAAPRLESGQWAGNGTVAEPTGSDQIGQRRFDGATPSDALHSTRRIRYNAPRTIDPSTLTLALLRTGYSLKYEPILTGSRAGKSKIKLLSDGIRFALIIFKIATLFSPLKIFLPFSWLFFALGLANYAYTYFTAHRLTNMTLLCFIAGFLFFLLGLISEQIAQLRFDRSEDH
jgi:hypothetical protein